MVYLKSQRAPVPPSLTVMAAAEAGTTSGATPSACVVCSLLILLLSAGFPSAAESADLPGESSSSSASSASSSSPPGPSAAGDGGGSSTREAIERLSHVFGLDRVPTHTHHRTPPEYMVDLYNSVAYTDGITKTAAPHDADVVRGFPDRATSHQMQFKYNVSNIGVMEDVLQAEFHLYKLRPRARYRRRQRAVHITEIRLYQILRDEEPFYPSNLQILGVRRVSVHDHGWQTFVVSDTVRQWANDSTTNHGFLVTATSLQGEAVNGTYVRFAQRHEHHDSKQPILLVFTEDREYRLKRELDDELESLIDSNRQKYVQFMNEGFRAKNGPIPYDRLRFMSPKVHKELSRGGGGEGGAGGGGGGGGGAGRKRVKRASGSDYNYKPSYSRRKKRACQRQPLYVDFVKIGWSGWIISPKGFKAFHCKGTCPFPLGQNQKPTNHATVQSIVHALRIEKDVAQPCCVPNKLYPISLLYFDDDENVILKQYDDMVASSCGCH